MTRHEKNFENALSEVQRQFLSAPSSPDVKVRLDRLQDAIAKMFDRLNVIFEQMTDFEFLNDLKFSIRKYLTRFQEIFSFNQDLLLELQYEDAVLTASGARWGGVQRPGIRPIADPSILGIGDKHKRRWTPQEPPFTLAGNLQPYFKLHGSSNWYTIDGENLLVMGANKDLMIKNHAVLRWYPETFKWYLSQPNTILMVIGYSFSDRHINELILEAWRSGNLAGIFVVDLQGRAVLNPTRHLPMPMHSDLEDIPNLGSSTRLLSSTFAGDAFEHQKFTAFFDN